MKRIFYFLVTAIVIVSCGDSSEKNAIAMQIAVYEDAMSEISASRNIAEYNSIRSEVKERIKEIKDDYSAELRSINWNALKKNKEAMDMKDSLMAAVKRYGHLCKNKRKEFLVK